MLNYIANIIWGLLNNRILCLSQILSIQVANKEKKGMEIIILKYNWIIILKYKKES